MTTKCSTNSNQFTNIGICHAFILIPIQVKTVVVCVPLSKKKKNKCCFLEYCVYDKKGLACFIGEIKHMPNIYWKIVLKKGLFLHIFSKEQVRVDLLTYSFIF